MNTTKVGDAFEKRCHNAILIGISDGQLAIVPDSARVFQKKAYFSKKRQANIVFDLAVEIWPPNAKRPSVIYLIECKDYSKKIPVDDIEEFNSKVQQIADGGSFIKAVFITGSSFQKGALLAGKNFGFMMIELKKSNELSIIFHKKERAKGKSLPFIDLDKKMESFFHKVFGLYQEGKAPTLSKAAIKKQANKILDDIDPLILQSGRPVAVEVLIRYFEKTYGVTFNLNMPFDHNSEKQLLGSFDPAKKEIQIHEGLNYSNRQAFVIAHEMGHYILHRHLNLSQEYYDSFLDSEYDFWSDRHALNNLRHWVEWQANYFAASLLMPQVPLKFQLVKFQISQGISKYGHIYLDHQSVNRRDFNNILNHLSNHFHTSKASIRYRLEEFNLITYASRKNNFQASLRDTFHKLENDFMVSRNAPSREEVAFEEEPLDFE